MEYDNNHFIIASRAYSLHLRQDVGELSRWGNMQYVNLTHGNMIANKVKIDLDVLGALVLDGVRWHVDSADIVAEHNRS